MKRLFIVTNVLLISFIISFAQQKATVKEYKKIFKTYPFSDPDPVPGVGRIYPYYRFDGYTNSAVQKEWKVVELENDYIKIMILPEIGGKIWAAIEKTTGKSFLYYNHVGFAKPDGSWGVVDVWESAEAFAEFGKTLEPIIQKTGVNVPDPMVLPAHYVLLGQPETEPA